MPLKTPTATVCVQLTLQSQEGHVCVLTKETPQLSAVHQDKTMFLELGVLQLALLTSIEMQEQIAKIVTQAVMDVTEEQTQTVIPATLQTTSKTMAQEPVYASLDITETVQSVRLVMARAKSVQEEVAT
eukprot:CAMPEP_0202428624 /NCGR_PEP_ID=MMETSP1345-20130828/2588_1 /ASSEMBLY_ACC=CAM_ASM_000843 /TAXON_ID=342563 /ORGANISM="Fabrea Fabrea salina" /LENGTH=128 /DNA_ID=CAMNT_0049039649 /DNA_START=96 /DNA_END=478 /DNA_ORIENTATION=+